MLVAQMGTAMHLIMGKFKMDMLEATGNRLSQAFHHG